MRGISPSTLVAGVVACLIAIICESSEDGAAATLDFDNGLSLGNRVSANVEVATRHLPREFPEEQMGISDDVLLQMMYMDNIEDEKLQGTYVSLESLQLTKKFETRVMDATAAGPAMGPIKGTGADTNMQSAVWLLEKGKSRTDCVSIRPLNRPGWYLRLQEVQVSERTQTQKKELGESDSVDATASDARLFNTLFKPGNNGAVDALLGKPKQPVLAEAAKQKQAETSSIFTVILSKNDGTLNFLKQATWCIRNPRAPSFNKKVKTAALEAMGKPGFFLMRKEGTLVGIGLGSSSANFKDITWQLADPKWELCPQNCSGHGRCGKVTGTAGKCGCVKGWANLNCGVLAGWPTIKKATAGGDNVPVVKAIQALLAHKGIPQDFDGKWTVKTEAGLKTFLKANAKKYQFKQTDPVNAKVWEALVPAKGKEPKAGWGKDPTGAERNVVKAIQMLLKRRFEYSNNGGGIFDAQTEKDVKNLQKRFHLKKMDGVVDKDTWNKLVAELPSTIMQWPLEKNHQPFPDEQLYYVQNRGEDEYANCRLYGTYAWSKDVPGKKVAEAPLKAKKGAKLSGGSQASGSGSKSGSGAGKGIVSTQWKNKYGTVKADTRSLDFQFTGPYRGGYYECNEMKGFDMGARSMTVEMWFKPSTIAQRATLFSSCDKKMRGFYLGYRGYYVRVGISAQSFLDAPVRFFEDTWHHVAGVFDGRQGSTGKLTLYLDGKQIGTKVTAETFIPWRGKKKRKAPTVGAFSGDVRYRHFWGKVDNVRISRKALNVGELLLKSADIAAMNPPTKFLVDSKAVKPTLKFAYSGKKGPGSWSTLILNNTLCSAGQQQSPINLPSPIPDKTMAGAGKQAMPASHLRYVDMQYHSTPVKSDYDGAVYGMTLGNNAGELILNDEYFIAKRVKFHTPSEHTIGGIPAEMEMQIEHVEKTSGKVAIVTILFQMGRINHTLKPVFDMLAKKKKPQDGYALGSFDLLDIIPYDPGFVVYHGSLTVPPCTEGVRWIVIDKPLTASKAQINLIKNVVGDNARPQQNLNGRPIKRVYGHKGVGFGMASMAEQFLSRLKAMQLED
jgi:carbonic anhydrase